MTETELLQRICDDISELKVCVKEAIINGSFLRKDHDELKAKVLLIEKGQNECPARLRHNAWGLTAKDVLWAATFLAATGGCITAMIKYLH